MSIRRRLRLAAAFFALLSCVVTVGVLHAEIEVPEPDLSTPRRAVAAFLTAVDADDYDRAARVLDLGPVGRSEQGRETARKLYVVLERVAWVELSQLSDDPNGRPEDGENSE